MMKRQTLRLSVKKNKPVTLKANKTKATTVASQEDGGTITLKGTRNGV